MSPVPFLFAVEILILLYFLAMNGIYFVLNLLAVRIVREHMQREAPGLGSRVPTGFEPPISIIVPAYNEEHTIAASVRSLLQLQYSEFEVIVVNDGSRDRTLEVLLREFGMERFPEVYRDRIPTSPVRGLYRSRLHPNLRVIDKENGRKADAVNAGINAARYPIFLSMDGDSILQRDSLLRVVQPFLEDPRVVACGGTVRVANGCSASGGLLTEMGLPRSPLALFQIVEYLRAFLFGRMGWTTMTSLLIISGAFGLFHKETVIEAGGYRRDTLGEDMELTVRLHRHLRARRRPYRITFVPDPICWTEVPETLRGLARQRVRWQRGLAEALFGNRRLLFHPRGGAPGWVGLPYYLIFEWASPLVEVFGYLFMIAGFACGIIGASSFLLFLGVAVGLGVLLSSSALLLEEMSFHMYPRQRHLAILILAAILENFGYRQLNALLRLAGLAQWAAGRRPAWGEMRRSGEWARAGSA
jgi:cellulose synthase/poly-beta-1,6-N-acetylglucosamine synthase-like glycosyltransferase